MIIISYIKHNKGVKVPPNKNGVKYERKNERKI